MIDQSTQTISEQPLMPFTRMKGALKVLLATFQTKSAFMVRLGIISSLMLCTVAANAATIYFNTIYKASGTTYTVNTQSLAKVSLVSGSGFRFTSANPNDVTFANGNNEAGTLNYINSSGVAVSISGIISRQNKTGNTTLSVNFITSAGEAYALVVPTKESSFTSQSGFPTVGTSSDPIDPVLNALLSSQGAQPILSVSSPTVTEGTDLYAEFTVSLSIAANAGSTFTASVSAGTASLSSDFTNALEYYNGSAWVSLSGAYTIPQGATQVRIRVPIVNDSNYEPTENFTLNTGVISGSNVLNSGGAFGSATINDNDAPIVPTVLTAGTLNQFTICAGTASSAQTFTVSGTLLTSNVVVTALTGN